MLGTVLHGPRDVRCERTGSNSTGNSCSSRAMDERRAIKTLLRV